MVSHENPRATATCQIASHSWELEDARGRYRGRPRLRAGADGRPSVIPRYPGCRDVPIMGIPVYVWCPMIIPATYPMGHLTLPKVGVAVGARGRQNLQS